MIGIYQSWVSQELFILSASFLIESMENTSNKTIWIILPIVLLFLLSCASTHKEKTESRDADFYIKRGNAYHEKGQYDQAILDYNKALEINPKDALAYYHRGISYEKKGQYDQAISNYTKALEINPRDTGAYYNRGMAYGNKGQYDHAILDYTKALEFNPRFTEAYNNRGVALYGQGPV